MQCHQAQFCTVIAVIKAIMFYVWDKNNTFIVSFTSITDISHLSCQYQESKIYYSAMVSLDINLQSLLKYL